MNFRLLNERNFLYTALWKVFYSLKLEKLSIAEILQMHKLLNAYNLGKAFAETTKAIEESQKPKTEAFACETAKKVTEFEFGTKALVGGIPVLIAESIAFPPLALAIPLAGAALPQAFANLHQVSKIGGEAAEEVCEELFSGGTPKK